MCAYVCVQIRSSHATRAKLDLHNIRHAACFMCVWLNSVMLHDVCIMICEMIQQHNNTEKILVLIVDWYWHENTCTWPPFARYSHYCEVRYTCA